MGATNYDPTSTQLPMTVLLLATIAIEGAGRCIVVFPKVGLSAQKEWYGLTSSSRTSTWYSVEIIHI